MAYKCYSSKPWLGGHQTSFNFPTYNSRIADGPEHRKNIFNEDSGSLLSSRLENNYFSKRPPSQFDSSSSRMLILIIQMFWGCLRERWNKFHPSRPLLSSTPPKTPIQGNKPTREQLLVRSSPTMVARAKLL